MNRTLVTADNDTERFPEVDPQGYVIGQITRAQAHDGTMRLHPVVHLHLFDPHGNLYLQHRANWKKVQPDRWDTATGGHIDYGETPQEALAREVLEEIGLTPDQYQATLLKTYIYQSPIERELVYIYTATSDAVPYPSPTETQGGRFWRPEEIRSSIGHELFTPMFEQEYPMLEI